MERYREIESVGEGTYGVVIKCIHKATGTLVAIKEFKEAQDKERVKRTAARELHVLRTLHHPNLVSFLESFHARGQLHLVFELMDRSLLADLEAYPEGLSAASVESNMLQLVLAVQFMHSNQVMHRDLKPENMLLSKEGVLKLCDFGFARHLEGPNAIYSDYVATRWYRAPELLLGLKQYKSAVDIWSLGCLLVEMATGIPLFAGETDIDQLGLIMSMMGRLCKEHMRAIHNHSTLRRMTWTCHPQMTNSLECRFPTLTPSQLQFVKACIHPDPARRPTCAQLLQTPFLQKAAANMPASIVAAQAASQQSLVAFAAQTQRVPVTKTGKRQSLQIPLTAQLSDLPAESPRIGAQHTRHMVQDATAPSRAMPSWEPFLSPTAPAFHPRRHFRDAPDPNAMPRQASDASMPDVGHSEEPNVQAGKGVGSRKQRHAVYNVAGLHQESMQRNGSGYSSASTMTEGSATPRGSKRSLLPELVVPGSIPDPRSAYSSQSDSPSKKSRLYKEEFTQRHSGQRLDSSWQTSDPPHHCPDPAGHSPDASVLSTSSGQENSQHNSNAPVIRADGALHQGGTPGSKMLQGFAHADKAQHHRELPGAESIVSRDRQRSTAQHHLSNSADVFGNTIRPNQQNAGWEQAVMDAQQQSFQVDTGNRAGQYAASALDEGHTTGTALKQGTLPVPTQPLQGSRLTDTTPSGLRLWEHVGCHPDLGITLYTGQQQQQQQQQSTRPSRHNIVFGDFSPADLQYMQLSQEQAAVDNSTHAEVAADSSSDAQTAEGQSWWQSLLGSSSYDERNAQQAGPSSVDLPSQVSQWGSMLLPGVMFAADWASQQDAQVQQGTDLRASNGPRDLLERRQYYSAKQKLA